MGESVISTSSENSTTRLIGMALGIRLFIDTSSQLFNPFLAIIATGLGINVIAMGGLVSLRSAMGLTAPFFGALTSRKGSRFVMRITLFMTALGLLIVGVSNNFWLAALGMMVMGIGGGAFVPLLQAYVSHQLPYSRRARIMAIIEYSWAFAGMIGLFSAGQLIAHFGWRTPFFVLATALFVGWFFLGYLPLEQIESPLTKPHQSQSWYKRLRTYVDLGPNRLSAWSTVLIASLHLFAANQLLIIHGEWLSYEYGLGAAQLGTVALIMGGAIWAGSILVSLISDRLGIRRSVLWGTIACLLAYSILPLANTSLKAAITSLVLCVFCFEFTIVSYIPLLSGQLPNQPSKLFTLSSAVGLIGITMASITGPWIYTQLGVWGLGSLSASLMLLCVLIISTWVKEPSTGAE